MRYSVAPLYCLGASYKTTPLALLERLSVDESEYVDFVGGLRGRLHASLPESEIAVLGTCNRLEIYWTAGSVADLYRGMDKTRPASSADLHSYSRLPEIRRALAERTGVSEEELARHLQFFSGSEAIEHLFRVAAGLDSLVLGEHQVLGQVEEALTDAVAVGTAGSALKAVFTAAVRSGRRARHETDIGRNPRDVSTVAIQLAERIAGELADRKVVVAGTGEMGRLTVKALHHRGATGIDVVNRRLDRARALAEQWGLTAHPLSELSTLLRSADIMIASTGSRRPILGSEEVRGAMIDRGNRELILIDLAVPRDIAPDVADVPGVHLFDLDGLREIAEAGERERMAAIPAVETIIADELVTLRSELGREAVRPVLSELWTHAEEVRSELVRDAQTRVQGIAEAHWLEIDRLTRILTNKLLHAPSARLRKETLNGRAVEFAKVIAELFDLDSERGDPDREPKQ